MEAFYNKETNILTLSAKDDGVSRDPVHICCVVDISGSMGTEAVVQNEQGNKESTGLTVLSLVGYSIRTVVKSMKPDDLISIVTFSSESKIILQPTKADEWATIDSKIESMRPTNMTNLWGGVEKGFEVINSIDSNFNTSMFVFTDGIPNIDPPRGYGYELAKSKIDCTIHTFGFGYSINTEVLTLISKIGNGSFNYICDAGMVGTVFIHAVANFMAQCAKDIKIGSKNLGTLRYGQPRHFYIETKPDSLVYTDTKLKTKTSWTKDNEYILVGENDSRIKDRFVLCECIQYLLGNQTTENKNKKLNETIELVNTNDYKLDLSKEVKLAIEPSNFSKWGQYYLFSLLNAHEQQYCNNFKDPGIQSYGTGVLFEHERTNSETQFKNLPLPKPTITYSDYGRCGGGHGFGGGTTMSTVFLNASAGCYGPDTLVATDTGFKKVSDIRALDRVKTDTGISKVKYVVISPITDMYKIGDVKITAWHPVKWENKWVFPEFIDEDPQIYKEFAYNLVTEDGNTVFLGENNLEAVTLGHKLVGKVVSHPYFGSDLVKADLEHLANINGMIKITRITRNNVTGLIDGMF